jgi:hypothetical protein
VTTFLTRHFVSDCRLVFHSKQRLIGEQLETACLWHEQVVEVVHIALNLANDMQLLVLDLGVEALLVGEELDFEGLVEYLEGVVGDCVAFGWYYVTAVAFVLDVLAVCCWVGHRDKPIKLFDPLNSGQAIKDREIQIQNPDIPIGEHEIDPLINLLTHLNSPHIDPNIGNLLQQLLIPDKVQIHFCLVEKQLNPVLENIDWQFDYHVAAVVGTRKKYCLRDLFCLLRQLVLGNWVFVHAALENENLLRFWHVKEKGVFEFYWQAVLYLDVAQAGAFL